MALLDLGHVTRTLVTLVTEAIKASPVGQPCVVTSLPPDKLNEANSVSLYLYHVSEEAALKNQPWRGRPDTPIRYSPMGLNLHYVVTTRSALTDSHDPLGPYTEQLLLGLTMKALHDHPIIDDHTEIRGVKILQSQLVGDENQLRLALRHVPVGEAVSYWTAGAQPLRLSAYYEASVVLLEPEEPTVAGGRALTWGVEVFVGSLPRLTGSRGTVTFTIPGEATARAIDIQPAQVAVGAPLELVGTALGGGAVDVLIRGPGWTTGRSVGATWGASVTGDRVFLQVQDLIDTEPTLPGAYTAAVQVTRTSKLADGTSHQTVVVSNETPFQIVPALTTIGAPAPTGVFTITGGAFLGPGLITRASIGPVQLVAGTAGALAPGEFAITSAASLELRLPIGIPSGQAVPVRVIVNGGESAPRWVIAP